MDFEYLKQQYLAGSTEIRAAILIYESENNNLTPKQTKELLTSTSLQEMIQVEKYLF
jgi:hypothetical protein